MKKIECVIMDWAGTAVDYGCFAPVAAFLKAFAEKGLTVTMEEARGPMGMTKIDHIRELFKLPSVTEQFKQNYNRNWTEEDVVSIYKEFEKHLFASLEEYTTPIPGVIEVIEKLKRDGIKIGSTTGYTTAMMDIVLPGAAAHGYTTDNCVTSNNLPAGRPQPYMIYQNMIDLAIPSGQQRNGTHPRGNRKTACRRVEQTHGSSQKTYVYGRCSLCSKHHCRTSRNY